MDLGTAVRASGPNRHGGGPVWASAGTNAGRREGQLDQEGGFVIPGLPPGDWTVTVSHGGREVSQTLHLGPDQETGWIDLELDDRATPD